MPYPYSSLSDVISEINTYIITNGLKRISGSHLNDTMNGLAQYISGALDSGSMIDSISGSISKYTLTSSFNSLSSSLNTIIGYVYASESKYVLTSSYQTDSASFHLRINNTFISESNYVLTSSYLSDSASFLQQIDDVYSSESNYVPTASFNASINGTTGYVPKFSGSHGFNNSFIFVTGNSAGFGVTNPTGTIHISGGYIRIEADTNPYPGVSFKNATSNYDNALIAGNKGNANLITNWDIVNNQQSNATSASWGFRLRADVDWIDIYRIPSGGINNSNQKTYFTVFNNGDVLIGEVSGTTFNNYDTGYRFHVSGTGPSGTAKFDGTVVGMPATQSNEFVTYQQIKTNVSGTVSYIPKFTAANTIGNTNLIQSGVDLTLSGSLTGIKITFGSSSFGVNTGGCFVAGNQNSIVPSGGGGYNIILGTGNNVGSSSYIFGNGLNAGSNQVLVGYGTNSGANPLNTGYIRFTSDANVAPIIFYVADVPKVYLNKSGSLQIVDSADLLVSSSVKFLVVTGSTSVAAKFVGRVQGTNAQNWDEFVTLSQISGSGSIIDSSVFVTTSSFTSFSSSYYNASASFNIRVTSNSNAVSNIIAATGAFATTGSNTFRGTEIISGSVRVSGSVGINTSPATAFHVYTTNNNAYIVSEGSGSFNTGYQIRKNGTLQWQMFSDGNDFLAFYNGVTTNRIFVIENAAPSNSLYIDAAGNTGINTNSPATKFDIKGDGVYNLLQVKGSTGSVILYVSESGYTGIGTNSPESHLDIRDGTIATSSLGPVLTLSNPDNQSIDNTTILGTIKWSVDDNSTGRVREAAAKIRVVGTGVWNATSAPCYLGFGIHQNNSVSGSGFYEDAMMLTSNGTLVVTGSITASSLLSLGAVSSSASQVNGDITIAGNVVNGSGGGFTTLGTSAQVFGSVYVNNVINAGTGSGLAFRQASIERARFASSSGYFLVGTLIDNGVDRIQVQGTVSASGFVGTASYASNAQTASVAPRYLTTASYTTDSSSFDSRIRNITASGVPSASNGVSVSGSFVILSGSLNRNTVINPRGFTFEIWDNANLSGSYLGIGTSTATLGEYGVGFSEFIAQNNLAKINVLTNPTGSGSIMQFTTNYMDLGFISSGSTSSILRVTSSGIIVSGSASFTGTVTAQAFFESSLRVLKDNIYPFSSSALDIINKTEVVSFNYKKIPELFKIGIIADDTHEYISSKEHNVFDHGNSIGLLLKAVQELSTRVEHLEKDNKYLRELINANK